jgi:hypothetical protein
MAMADTRGNLGFGFGTAFHKHQKAMLQNAGMNYFRLYMKGDQGVYYFLHTETGSFTVDEGDVHSRAQLDAKAIGMSMDLGLFNLDVMIGNSTLKVDDAEFNEAEIGDMNTSDPFVDLGVRYSYVKNNASLDLSFSYRYHTISNDIEILGADGDEDTINDLSSINLGVGVSYIF